MTLRELLNQNHGKYCYPAGVITESVKTEGGALVEARLAEVWQIPINLLNKEIEVS